MLFAPNPPMLKPAKRNQTDMRAVLVDGEDYTQRSGDEREIQIRLEAQMPFQVVKNYDEDKEHEPDHDGYEMGDDDVIIRGPVYVGNADMLDRHNELVAPDAIMASWDDYQKNPVILYNHSKTYGVIGRMLDVEMGTWDGIEGSVPIGRAVIDGGEKDIVRKIRKGFLRAFSIGFIARAAVKECKDDEKGDTCYMTFTKIDWLETSVVDVPASPNALFNVQKHILGYEDMGDSFAILFEKQPAESPSEEPPAGGDMESPNEANKSSDCPCGGHSNKREIETDVFTTLEEAEARAAELGCDGIHTHTIDGDDGEMTVYMPCSSHADYTEATGDELETPATYGIESDTPDELSEIDELKAEIAGLKELLLANIKSSEGENSESENTDSLNTPIDKGIGQQVKQMADENIIETPEEEVVVASEELEVPTEEMQIKHDHVEEEVVKSEEAPEAEAEEAPAEEVPEEELPEEVVEEVAEATEEESADEPTSTEILFEVVKVLSKVESRLSDIESQLKTNEDIEALKSELDAIKSEKEAAEAEAQIEAEVAKRVAELVGNAPEVKAAVPEASPKSLDSTPLDSQVKKSPSNRHDPRPEVSKGMNGLAGWLEMQISKRGA